MCGSNLRNSSSPEEREAVQNLVCGKCELTDEDADTCRTQAAAFIQKAAAWVRLTLSKGGVSPRDLEAKISTIPDPLYSLIPGTVLEAVRSGNILTLTSGFGLGGYVGCGKSCAIAALLKLGLSRWAHASTTGWDFSIKPSHFGPPTIFWANWPDISNQLQSRAVDSDFVHTIVGKMKNAKILVLDDLGKERLPTIKDEHATPFAQAQLEICIDYRNGQMTPTFWTTNISEDHLISIYGAATYSRLIQGNPIEWVEEPLDNLRLSSDTNIDSLGA